MQGSQAIRWCFTLNNYSEIEVNEVKSWIERLCKYFVVGFEKGENGTPHLQGYVEFKSRKRFTEISKFNPRLHWEKAKGNREQNREYCTKSGNYTMTAEELSINEQIRLENLQDYQGITWKPWQQQILDIIDTTPDRRTINWIWEETGGVGKSFLCDYILLTRCCIKSGGKKDDVYHQVATMIFEEKKKPEIIILDIPRHNIEYINYGVLEDLQSRVIQSGKYEGHRINMPKTHVIVFANVEPDYYKFSADRWNVIYASE